MPLSDEIRALADQCLARLDEARGFHAHTRQAWRFVLDNADEGRAVGVGVVAVDSGLEVSAAELESLSQVYVNAHLAQAVFKGLASLLEDWVLGLIRLWLTAYPKQLDAASNEAAGRLRGRGREEIQVPLSDILAAPDIPAILADVVERVVRDLAYQRPDFWFRFLDNRVNLGCPDESQRSAVREIKAARDALEHNRGVTGPDYLDKAGASARFALGEYVQLDEPYLLQCFALLRDIIQAMTAAALRKSAIPPSSDAP